MPIGRRFGSTGSDLGYGLKLANLVAERAVLREGEHLDDVVAGCFSCGTPAVIDIPPVARYLRHGVGLRRCGATGISRVAPRRSWWPSAGPYSPEPATIITRQRAIADLVQRGGRPPNARGCPGRHPQLEEVAGPTGYGGQLTVAAVSCGSPARPGCRCLALQFWALSAVWRSRR